MRKTLNILRGFIYVTLGTLFLVFPVIDVESWQRITVGVAALTYGLYRIHIARHSSPRSIEQDGDGTGDRQESV